MPEQSGIPDRRGAGGGVGSVAEETARLLEALLGPAPVTQETPSNGGASDESPSPESPGSPGSPSGEPCPTCGHPDLGDTTTRRSADVCHLCPVCQVLRVVRSVRPETLDRLADLAAAVTESLRDAAAERWRTSAATDDASPAPARPQVQDIAVADDDGSADDPFDPAGRDDPDEPADPQDLEDVR